MQDLRTFTATEEDASKRLDAFLTERLPGRTRSGIKNLIKEGLVLVDGRPVKAGFWLRAGSCIEITVPPPPAVELTPEDVPLDIIYEDDDVIVVNKPAGMPAHPGAGRTSGTLVNALVAHTRQLSAIGAPLRPGIVHRLDMDTTGSMVVAKNDAAHKSLAAQFKEHSTSRRYLALVWGQVKKDRGVIDMAIGRDSANRLKISVRTRKKRRAVTNYEVMKRYPGFTLLALYPETGRTHQLRVHLSTLNHPVVGDRVYGKRTVHSSVPKAVADAIKKITHQLLHAELLGFTHPSTGERVEFAAPMPEDMRGLVELMETEFGGGGEKR